MVVAATHYNFKSMFAWNVFLYSGMFAIVGVYLWTLMEPPLGAWSKPAGLAAFAWRIVLTTGTGSIFGFLVARQAYGSALLAPLFIVMSFAWGLAVFLVVQSAMYAWNDRTLPTSIARRMRNLLGLFLVSVLYLVAVYHLTNLYFAKQVAFVRFILVDGVSIPCSSGAATCSSARCCPLVLIYHRASQRPVDAGGIVAGRRGRVRAALRLHHRRTGVAARDLPRLPGREHFR